MEFFFLKLSGCVMCHVQYSAELTEGLLSILMMTED
jgi:hypothetical protein